MSRHVDAQPHGLRCCNDQVVIGVPETRYALSGNVHIAYQVFGEGPDLVYLTPSTSHLELSWDDPVFARSLRRTASFARVILLDRRGSGMSDRVALPTLEEEAPDLLAVLDDVGSDRPFLCGVGLGGTFALFFAATYPNRTAGVIAYASPARVTSSDDYPWAPTPDSVEAVARMLEGRFSASDWDRATAQLLAPTRSRDESFVRWFGRMSRSGLTPASMAQFMRMSVRIDIRHILPTVSVPVLVLHRTGDLLLPVEQGRYLAEHITNAKYVELPGNDYLFFVADPEPVLDEIEAFVTGIRPQHEADRVLATVLFTDLVGHTARAAELGDKRWRELLDQHDELIEAEVRRFRGQKIKTTGDGVLATFDGPARAVRCAIGIREVARGLGFDIRAGLHCGEIEVRSGDVSGIAVNIASRVMDAASAREILASRTVTDLVAGSGLEFEDRGDHKLKGVPGQWQLYEVRR